jgi:hypothetical protein
MAARGPLARGRLGCLPGRRIPGPERTIAREGPAGRPGRWRFPLRVEGSSCAFDQLWAGRESVPVAFVRRRLPAEVHMSFPGTDDIRKPVVFLLASLCLASPAWATGAPSTSEKGALVRVITKWNDGSCDASTRTAWDNMVDSWYDDITDDRSAPSGHGSLAWWEDGFYKNGNIVDSQFCDPSLVSWGNDDGSDNADEPDALMVGFHGSHFSGTYLYAGSMRVNESGTGDCYASQGNMLLGNYDLEFAHFSSCHSMCEYNWDTDVGDGDAEWFTSLGGVHQIDGFHGIMYIATTYNSRYSGFSDDAFYFSISDAWVDNQYSNGYWTGGDDHCPVALVAGSTESDVEARTANEEYDYVYGDTSPTWKCITWIGGCDPDGEPALP